MLWSVFVSLQGAEWSWTSIGRLQNRYFVCVCMWLCVCVHVTLCACACDFVCVCVRAWCLLWVLLKSFLVQRDCSYSCCNRCSFERPRYQRYHVSTHTHTKSHAHTHKVTCTRIWCTTSIFKKIIIAVIMVKLMNQSLPRSNFLCLCNFSKRHTTVDKPMMMIIRTETVPAMMEVVEAVYRETALTTLCTYFNAHIPIRPGVVIGETLLCTVVCFDMLTSMDVSRSKHPINQPPNVVLYMYLKQQQQQNVI